MATNTSSTQPPQAPKDPPQEEEPATPSRARKALKWGSIASGVAGIGQFLGNVDKIQVWCIKTIGLVPSRYLHDILSVVVGTILVAGCAGLIYWAIARRRVANSRFEFVLVSLAVPAILAVGGVALARMPAAPDPNLYLRSTASQWVTRLFDSQRNDGGIAVSFTDPQAPTQVWTTAQALSAILTREEASTKDRQAGVRRAIDYIERAQITEPPGGWGYFEEWRTGVTEISGWVCTAELAALQPSAKVWDSTQVQDASTRAGAIVSRLASSQQHDGGWGPTADVVADGYSRTYSTVMATWCLLEASRSEALSTLVGDRYDDNITLGLKWLTTHYDATLGWVPNPFRQNQNEVFLGLDAQTLFVVSVASRKERFKAIALQPGYVKARDRFLHLQDFASKGLGDNQRLHDSDRYVRRSASPGPTAACSCPFTIENSTFLWYPWALAAARVLAENDGLSDPDRALANSIVETLVGRFPEASALTDTGLNYIGAEMLIGAPR